MASEALLRENKKSGNTSMYSSRMRTDYRFTVGGGAGAAPSMQTPSQGRPLPSQGKPFPGVDRMTSDSNSNTLLSTLNCVFLTPQIDIEIPASD